MLFDVIYIRFNWNDGWILLRSTNENDQRAVRAHSTVKKI
jgi:hypothetical protein